MKRLIVSAILGVGLLFFAAQASAYNVIYHTEVGYRIATAITGLTVGSLGTYDVEFSYSTPLTFAFNNFTDAKTAADAINDALNTNEITYVADTSAYNLYAVPYAYSGGYYYTAYTEYSSGWSAKTNEWYVGNYDFMHAVLAPSASVPIPPAIWLLASGLLGLMGIRKKLKK